MRFSELTAGAVALLSAGQAQAAVAPLPLPASCTGVPNMRYQYSVSAGWKVTKIAGSLQRVRTILWDTNGNMIVSQAGKGLSVHTFGSNGCINSTTMLTSSAALNHGLALSPDGKTLYASGERQAWSWDYNPDTRTIANNKLVVTGMDSGIHSTRNVMVAPKAPNLLLVQVGSNANLDMATVTPAGGRANIKIFDMTKTPTGGHNFKTGGETYGYGLRNEIGFVADPNGHFWGVENSADDHTRTVNGQRRDIHNNNPAEELNYLGDPATVRDAWYGYPTCFAVWNPADITDKKLKTGDNFVLAPNASFTDETCAQKGAIPPRLTFQAHSAPIWNAFDANATNMYVTFHGSWNRSPATGFKVVEIPFTRLENGLYDPVAPRDSQTGYKDIFQAANPSSCTANGLTQSNCFRLTAAAWDPAGRGLFVGSDNSAEGEIYILSKTS